MPILKCREGGRPGFKVQNANACFTYEPGDLEDKERARQRALAQQRAIKANQNKDN